jgi:hypothetical protein
MLTDCSRVAQPVRQQQEVLLNALLQDQKSAQNRFEDLTRRLESMSVTPAIQRQSDITGTGIISTDASPMVSFTRSVLPDPAATVGSTIEKQRSDSGLFQSTEVTDHCRLVETLIDEINLPKYEIRSSLRTEAQEAVLKHHFNSWKEHLGRLDVASLNVWEKYERIKHAWVEMAGLGHDATSSGPSGAQTAVSDAPMPSPARSLGPKRGKVVELSLEIKRPVNPPELSNITVDSDSRSPSTDNADTTAVVQDLAREANIVTTDERLGQPGPEAEAEADRTDTPSVVDTRTAPFERSPSQDDANVQASSSFGASRPKKTVISHYMVHSSTKAYWSTPIVAASELRAWEEEQGDADDYLVPIMMEIEEEETDDVVKNIDDQSSEPRTIERSSGLRMVGSNESGDLNNARRASSPTIEVEGSSSTEKRVYDRSSQLLDEHDDIDSSEQKLGTGTKSSFDDYMNPDQSTDSHVSEHTVPQEAIWERVVHYPPTNEIIEEPKQSQARLAELKEDMYFALQEKDAVWQKEIEIHRAEMEAKFKKRSAEIADLKSNMKKMAEGKEAQIRAMEMTMDRAQYILDSSSQHSGNEIPTKAFQEPYSARSPSRSSIPVEKRFTNALESFSETDSSCFEEGVEEKNDHTIPATPQLATVKSATTTVLDLLRQWTIVEEPLLAQLQHEEDVHGSVR